MISSPRALPSTAIGGRGSILFFGFPLSREWQDLYNRFMIKIDPAIFHAYDVRGIYPAEINPETAYRIAWAFGQYLKKDLKKELPFSVVLGQDMRGSSPFLAREAVRGLNDQGIDVVDIGRVPTPALYYTVAFKDYVGGIMVTASHNPKEYNGFKVCGPKAVPLGLGSGLEKIQAYASQEDLSRVGSKGKLLSLPNATAAYVQQDLSYLNSGKIAKFRIVADPANCMGSLYLDELFKAVPAELIKINWELNGNMPSHEADPLRLETLRQLQEVMKNEKADFGIATDGDGDRIVFLDERAERIPAFIVIGLVARMLLKRYPQAKIGYDLRSSRVAKEMIEEAGGVPIETKVGHSNIKTTMREQDILFAGELSAHYYFRENYNYESPVFVTAMLLFLRSESDKPFSEMWRPYNKYFQSGEINFEVSDKQTVLDHLEQKYQDGKISRLDGLKIEYADWWFNVRPSNTEALLRLNLEANTQELLDNKSKEISEMIQKQ